MSTYAIGDVQGCFRTLRALVKQLRFDPRRDRLWFVGDLVNRGPRSRDVLCFVRDLGDRAVVVLGNHDLHLVARHVGAVGAKGKDTLDPLLRAKDAAALVGWLRARPLLHREGAFTLVHAGLLPAWSDGEADALARGLESALQGPDVAELLRRDKGHAPDTWSTALQPAERARVALAAFTRLRTCASSTRMVLDFAGTPEHAPAGAQPWFALPHRRAHGTTVVFGHWAALGYARGSGFIALDSGCVWGRHLTAVRLEDGAVFTEDTRD